MSRASGPHFQPEKILLPLDFSASSNAALEAATEIAKKFQAEINLVHVIPPLPVVSGADFFSETAVLQSTKENAERQMAKHVASLASSGISARSYVELGSEIAVTIVSIIERENIDLIVLSTHGMSGWHPVIFGSTAEKLVKLVEIPLLLLRSTKENRGV
jgi:nucleotide-binding universal stress UspA family protein